MTEEQTERLIRALELIAYRLAPPPLGPQPVVIQPQPTINPFQPTPSPWTPHWVTCGDANATTLGA